ncbi:MAG: hypothetical protein AAFR40_10505, partial [Pseudomonadota bacterium]
MRLLSVNRAPQMTKLLRDLNASSLLALLKSDEFLMAVSSEGALNALDAEGQPEREPDRVPLRDFFAELPPEQLTIVERAALRITRLASSRADVMHLRIAGGRDFRMRSDLEGLPGALSRSAWSFANAPLLFRSVERALQMRSFREHRQVYEAHDTQSPVALDVGALDIAQLSEAISARLGLQTGCTIETIELPATDETMLEVMVSIAFGGALETKSTFEPDRRIDQITYRPADELILSYRPGIGRIEVCGRNYVARSKAVQLFASEVLKEELSERPLTQRNYDLGPFQKSLDIEIPATFADT